MMILICGKARLIRAAASSPFSPSRVITSHQDEIHRETQAVNVRQRGIVNRERQLEPLGGLHPQFKQLAGHGLILDDHHLVFHSIACLSRCKISVS